MLLELFMSGSAATIHGGTRRSRGGRSPPGRSLQLFRSNALSYLKKRVSGFLASTGTVE